MMANMVAAWIGFALGGVAGLTSGLFFHGEAWLGGYGSWRRRMVRLAHVAFFGIGLLNLSFALTARALGIGGGVALSSALLIVGAVTMPLACYLAAFRMAFRPLFAIPALSVIAGIVLFLWRIVAP
jgi:uncharacterized membrane protein